MGASPSGLTMGMEPVTQQLFSLPVRDFGRTAAPPTARMEQRGGWTALEAALPRRAGSSSQPGPGGSLERLQRVATALFPMGGGVGVSTLMATLARLDAEAGIYTGLVETAGPGLLRHYFSHTETAATPEVLTGPAGALDAPERGSEDRWLWDGLQQMSESVDRLLLEMDPRLPARAAQWCCGAGMRLAVLNPDLRCVLRLPAFLEQVQRQEQALGRALPVAVLLNRYDSSAAVHREIRARLEEQYGEALIPTPVRASEAINNSLARGGTVIDFDPDGGAADDFRRVGRWLTQTLTGMAQAATT